MTKKKKSSSNYRHNKLSIKVVSGVLARGMWDLSTSHCSEVMPRDIHHIFQVEPGIPLSTHCLGMPCKVFTKCTCFIPSPLADVHRKLMKSTKQSTDDWLLMHTHLYKFFPVKNPHTNQYRGLTYLTTDAYSYSFSPSATEIYRIIKTFQFIQFMLLLSNLPQTQFQPRYFRLYPFHVKDADLQQLLWAQDQQHLTEHFWQVSSVGEVEIRSSEQHFCQT